MDIDQFREFVFESLAEPVGLLDCVKCGTHEFSFLIMKNGEIFVTIDSREFKLTVEEISELA